MVDVIRCTVTEVLARLTKAGPKILSFMKMSS